MADGSRPTAMPRISLTISEALKYRIRLAAAKADMEPNEWCRVVLYEAVARAMKKIEGGE